MIKCNSKQSQTELQKVVFVSSNVSSILSTPDQNDCRILPKGPFKKYVTLKGERVREYVTRQFFHFLTLKCGFGCKNYYMEVMKGF